MATPARNNSLEVMFLRRSLRKMMNVRLLFQSKQFDFEIDVYRLIGFTVRSLIYFLVV
jgi:hypothetical protein